MPATTVSANEAVNSLLINKAISELKKNKLTETGKALEALWAHTTRADILGRMSMLKSIEIELQNEMRSYVDILLYAKRRITGSGNAQAAMTVVQIGLCIAAAACGGGIGLGLGLGASTIGQAKDSANPITGALALSQSAHATMKGDKLGSEDHRGNLDLGNSVTEQGINLGQLAAERFAFMQKRINACKRKYDYKKLSPACGKGPYTLAELKRKSTAWKHHGVGGTFAIEHDFAVAIGLEYSSFLKKLSKGEYSKLLKRSEELQMENPMEPHLITRFIIKNACERYAKALQGNVAAYADLMNQRGKKIVGYNGSDLKWLIVQAALILEQETSKKDASFDDSKALSRIDTIPKKSK
jgi:hypothetical protein